MTGDPLDLARRLDGPERRAFLVSPEDWREADLRRWRRLAERFPDNPASAIARFNATTLLAIRRLTRARSVG